MLSYLNDRLVPAEEAMVPVSDRGFLFGESIFETMAAYAGVVFRLREHLDRFAASAAAVGIVPPLGVAAMQETIGLVLRENGMRDALLRMTLTRGSGPRGLSTGGCKSPTFLIQCFPPPVLAPGLRERGADMVVARTRRIPPEALPSSAKTGNYLNNILAWREAEAAGANEALMLSVGDDVVEGTVSNVFFVAHNALFTPSTRCGAMPGITRKAVLELAAGSGLDPRELRLPLQMLSIFDEAFYTGTGVGIMPLRRIGDIHYAAPGPVTRLLSAALGELIAAEAGPAWNAGPIRHPERADGLTAEGALSEPLQA